MATISKRTSHWQAKVSWYDNDKKRHYKTKGGFKTKNQAKQWAAQQEAALGKGVALDKQISLSEYFARWVSTYKEPKLSKISLDRYHYTTDAIRDFFGQAPIKEISRVKYQDFINWYGANHAPSTVKKVNGFIRAAVNSAILDDYLTKDFTQGVALVANKDRVVKVEYLNQKEIKALLAHTIDGINYHFTSRYMIATAILTGMRLSEVQAMTWNDIDWLHSTIKISRSWDSVVKKFKETKNQSSKRTIKVNQQLLSLLRGLKSHTSSSMVFTNQYGTIPTSGAVNRTLRDLLADLGIHKHGFHFHSLRHSHVALLLASGIDLYAISKRLGHSSTVITANTYAYLIDEYKAKTDTRIVAALDELAH